MAESKNKFGLTFGQKPALKQTEVDVEKTEKTAQILQQSKGKLTRITIDVPQDIYTDMKIKVIKSHHKTLREYILHLVNTDLLK